MKIRSILSLLLLLGARSGSAGLPGMTEPLIQLICSFTIRDVPPGTHSAQVWVPVPRSDAGHTVSDYAILEDVPFMMRTDVRTGNRFLCFSLPDSLIAGGNPVITISFTLKREPSRPGHGGPPPLAARPSFSPVLLVRPGPSSSPSVRMPDLPPPSPDLSALRRLFLEQDRGLPVSYVPAGDDRNMKWHAAFIADLQSLGIPARFATGLVLGEEGQAPSSAGIHYWAEFQLPEGDWLPVGALLGDGEGIPIVLSAGRDVTAPGSSGPVPFFNSPRVELDGLVHHDVDTAWATRAIDRNKVMLAQRTSR